jgi:hypothetical protein
MNQHWTFLALLLTPVFFLFANSHSGARAQEIKIDASGLYSGLQAQNVLLDAKKTVLVLDARVFAVSKKVKGIVTTDVIELSAPLNGIINQSRIAKTVGIEVTADSPEKTAVSVEVRSGKTFFTQKTWSPWKKLDGLKGNPTLAGYYLQIRITLTSADKAQLPSVSKVNIIHQLAAAPPSGPGLMPPTEVVKNDIQKIRRSFVDFKYERPDHEKLVKFRKAAKLDEVVAGKMDAKLRDNKQKATDKEVLAGCGAGEDFLQLVRLMDWTGSCFNNRDKSLTKKTYKKTGYYDWNIDSVWRLEDVEVDGKKVKRPTIYGHCMSYAEVLTIAATAMGFKARHLSVVGVRDRSHEVCEIWVPSLNKWVYFDPSLTNYYYDKKTKMPLNIIEMHNIVTENFIPEGKTVNWFMSRGKFAREVQTYVKKRGGGKKPIGSRLGKFKYGAPMPDNYDWGWRHGYMVMGFVQMTPRNDFHANPKANPRKFEHYPGYGKYPLWTDAKSPPRRGSTPVSRLRDFYWTLDQASLVLTRNVPSGLSVELGNSMPFFKEYEVLIDGKTIEVTGSNLLWKLKKGENSLTVTPIDEFGKRGSSSTIVLKR